MSILICGIAIFVLQLVTAQWWWIMAVPALYSLLFGKSGWHAFKTGAFSAGLVWIAAAFYFMITASDIIAGRIGDMLSLPSPWLLVPITALVALLFAGSAGSFGYYLKDAFGGKTR